MPRHRCDPLGEGHRPHWLTVSDLQRNQITCRALPVGADLREVLRSALEQLAADGAVGEAARALE